MLFASVLVNLGFLGFFKYYNFFLWNLQEAFTFFGKPLSSRGLEIILPVGISFYTFQTLSYSIDVYRNKLKPVKDFVAFTAFVSFFPQLVAGPIERASNLLPQFTKPRFFSPEHAKDGLRQMLWGLFKKVVVADNCAHFANLFFNHSEQYGGSELALGAIFFSFQIYGDFSGYSDIAIGCSRLFDFDLKQNFAFPYFSRDIAEFWRRWHISLSTWFRDYLYIPLGGSKSGLQKQVINTFVIFVVSGFWHGANWTFIIWGLLHAFYFLPLLLLKKNRSNMDFSRSLRWKDLSFMIFTFTLCTLAWVFFRAESVSDAFLFLSKALSFWNWQLPNFEGMNSAFLTAIFILVLLIFEWKGRFQQHALEKLALPAKARYFLYYGFILIIYFFGGSQQEFIYFQF